VDFLCKFKNELQNFWIYIDASQSNFEKTAGLPSGWGRAAPKERKM
jgi:hypothetical protein